ncbi:MAG TPA: hypothetical protein VKV40_10360 [Ktedonobacteraceae bacterium]|nr:hypothetical protein [Ktedonobacteraceae bacterium]
MIPIFNTFGKALYSAHDQELSEQSSREVLSTIQRIDARIDQE